MKVDNKFLKDSYKSVEKSEYDSIVDYRLENIDNRLDNLDGTEEKISLLNLRVTNLEKSYDSLKASIDRLSKQLNFITFIIIIGFIIFIPENDTFIKSILKYLF